MEGMSTTQDGKIVFEEKKRNLEYNRLRTLIPQLAEKQTVSKIEVVEEAINYIAQLQNTLSSFREVSSEELRQQFLERETKRRQLIRERSRRTPSYLQCRNKRKPRTIQETVGKKR